MTPRRLSPCPAEGATAAGSSSGADRILTLPAATTAGEASNETLELARREKVQALFRHIIDETCKTMEDQIRAAGLDAAVVLADVKRVRPAVHPRRPCLSMPSTPHLVHSAFLQRWLAKLEATGALGQDGQAGLTISSVGGGGALHAPPVYGAAARHRCPVAQPRAELEGTRGGAARSVVPMGDAAPRGSDLYSCSDLYEREPIVDGVPDPSMQPPPAKRGRQ